MEGGNTSLLATVAHLRAVVQMVVRSRCSATAIAARTRDRREVPVWVATRGWGATGDPTMAATRALIEAATAGGLSASPWGVGAATRLIQVDAHVMTRAPASQLG